MSRVVVVGSDGQDGKILCARLGEQGSQVLPLGRDHHLCNIANQDQVQRVVEQWKPDQVYYLAAYHHASQETVLQKTVDLFTRSYEVHVLGLLNFLEAIKQTKFGTRLFYAASSLIFGETASELQDEQTPLNPNCAYGITKANGVQCCRFYRRTQQVFASVGILYNHESEYRQEKFVSQKIIRSAIRIKEGRQDKLILGSLSARIDWGYAPDFVDAMARILGVDAPQDFIIATGEAHSVREFVEIAFGLVGLDWTKHVEEDTALLGRKRSAMVGQASKLRTLTGWKPSVTFEQMITILINAQRNGH